MDSTAKDRLDQLTDVYKCLQTGSCSGRSSAEMARVIFSVVCELPDGDGHGSCHDSSMELTYIGVTVVGKIASYLTTQSLQAEVASYFVELLKVLFEDMDLMSPLVSESPHFASQVEEKKRDIFDHFLQKLVRSPVFHRSTSSRLKTRSPHI